MKKVLKFLASLFGVAKGPLIEKTIDTLGEKLEEFAVKQPKAAAALASSLYMFIDTTLEDASLKSKTDLDDLAVAEAKSEIKDFAARHNLELQELDED